MGFTKIRLLIRWLDPSSRQVKHAFAIKFDEYCTPLSPSDHVPPGSLLLSSATTSTITLPEFIINININDEPSFASPFFNLQVLLPPIVTPLGCCVMTCSYYNLQ
jgi:hypothetical protein